MSAKTAEEVRNEQVIRSLYSLAEGNAKDTSKFVSQFTDDGYFYDVSAGKNLARISVRQSTCMPPHFRTCTGSSTLSAASAIMSW